MQFCSTFSKELFIRLTAHQQWMKIGCHLCDEEDRIVVWYHESAKEFDLGLPRYHSLSPLGRGEYAEENLIHSETPSRGGQSIQRR